ncbi:MAG: PTS sugar transporter subunit IIB [Candidatus Eisenbacteria bacterium]|nr:PTS sugar transporter subunit IIB [Candidatus Eisenbacteria bacterium]
MPTLPGEGREAYLLFRVDDRLLHGQVTLGWGLRLGPKRYLIADDALAGDPITRRLYEAMTPEGSSTEVTSLVSLALGDDPAASVRRTILLVRDLAGAAHLLRAGVPGPLNLGGIHAHPGAVEILPFLHLDPDELRLALELIEEGYELEARELPEAESIGGEALRARLAEAV